MADGPRPKNVVNTILYNIIADVVNIFYKFWNQHGNTFYTIIPLEMENYTNRNAYEITKLSTPYADIVGTYIIRGHVLFLHVTHVLMIKEVGKFFRQIILISLFFCIPHILNFYFLQLINYYMMVRNRRPHFYSGKLTYYPIGISTP